MTLRCPKCQAEIQIGDESRTQQLRCATCGVELTWRPKPQQGTPCPACETVAPPGAVICVNCGLNLKTGTPTRIASVDDEPGEEEAPPSPPMRALMLIGEFAPGLLRPLVLIASLVVAVLGLGILAFGLALFAAGVLLSAFAVGAAGVIVYAHGIAWLLDGGLSWLPEALVDFDGPRWGIFFVLLLAPLVALFLLVKVLLALA